MDETKPTDDTETTPTGETETPASGTTHPTITEDVPAADGHPTSERGEIPADAEHDSASG